MKDLKGQEIMVQTTEATFEDNAAFIEVFAAANPFDEQAVAYRYRIEFDGVVPEREPRYRKA